MKTIAIIAKIAASATLMLLAEYRFKKEVERIAEDKVDETLYYINKYGMTKKEYLAKQKAEELAAKQIATPKES